MQELELDVGTFSLNPYKILCRILALPSETVTRSTNLLAGDIERRQLGRQVGDFARHRLRQVSDGQSRRRMGPGRTRAFREP